MEETSQRIEETLEESNGLLEVILDHAPVLVAYLDPQFNFIKVNRAYAAANEKEASFFRGKNHFDLFPDEENEAIFKHVVETGDPYSASAKPFENVEHPERG